MKVQAIKTTLRKIRAFRSLFLQESNFQFVYNKCHAYGWADTYLFMLDGTAVGYGAVWGQNNRSDRDAIFEFYVVKPYRKFAGECFLKLWEASGAVCVECQSNDVLLTAMLYQYSKNINAENLLFDDHFQTQIILPGISFHQQEAKENDRRDEFKYYLKQEDEDEEEEVVVATGGLMLNYNEPFADLYMEVKDGFRKQGLGSFMIQELKKTCYLMGRVPGARCNIDNAASKATLLKAGMKVCGYILIGKL